MTQMFPIVTMRRDALSDRRDCACLMAASSPWSQLHYGVDQCESLLASKGLDVWKAVHAEKIIGFAALRPNGIEGEPLLEYVCVNQEDRGKHIGCDLIACIEKACREKGDQNIYLFVSDFNVGAIRLYDRLGYRRVGAIPDYNVYGQTEYLYRKVLGKPRQQDRFREKRPGGLTKRQGAALPRDLNAGYARMKMTDRMLESAIKASTDSFKDAGKELPKDIDDALHAKFLKFICHRTDVSQKVIDQTFSTFSGSIALDRVFGAVRRMRPQCESMQIPLTVILPEPSLDLWQQLLRERGSSFSDVEIISVRDFDDSRDRTTKLIAQLRHFDLSKRRRHGGRRVTDSEAPKRQLMVIIDSPSNPQGFRMDNKELKDLAKACKDLDAVLVLDHCFLMAGIHFNPADRPANAFNDLDERSCDWYAIWDTGKSLDLAGDKVAFITASSRDLADKLRESLNVIQPSTFTAFRSLAVLSAVFENMDGLLDEYLMTAAKLCRDNYQYLLDHAPNLPHCRVNKPDAGSFVLLFCDLPRMSSEDFAAFWKDKVLTGVAVGKDFYAARFDEETPAFVRLSLYKPHDLFVKVVDTAVIEWPRFLEPDAVAVRRPGRRGARRTHSPD